MAFGDALEALGAVSTSGVKGLQIGQAMQRAREQQALQLQRELRAVNEARLARELQGRRIDLAEDNLGLQQEEFASGADVRALEREIKEAELAGLARGNQLVPVEESRIIAKEGGFRPSVFGTGPRTIEEIVDIMRAVRPESQQTLDIKRGGQADRSPVPRSTPEGKTKIFGFTVRGAQDHVLKLRDKIKTLKADIDAKAKNQRMLLQFQKASPEEVREFETELAEREKGTLDQIKRFEKDIERFQIRIDKELDAERKAAGIDTTPAAQPKQPPKNASEQFIDEMLMDAVKGLNTIWEQNR